MNATATAPSIYVASLSDYNAGVLHGAWIAITDDTTADELQDAINDMLATSTQDLAEEWAIHDYDGLPNMGEYASLESIAELGRGIAEHGDPFLAWVGMDPSNTEADRFTDCYLGEYDSEEDYARDYIESTGMLDGVPDTVANYFDYESFARDLFMDLDSIANDNGNVYVFDLNR